MSYHDAEPGTYPWDEPELDDDEDICPGCKRVVELADFALTGERLCCTCVQQRDELEIHAHKPPSNPGEWYEQKRRRADRIRAEIAALDRQRVALEIQLELAEYVGD